MKATYEYTAVDHAGRDIVGSVEADTEAEAQSKIKKDGLFATKIDRTSELQKSESYKRRNSPIRMAIKEAFGPECEPTDNQKEAGRILQEIISGLNSVFRNQNKKLKAKQRGGVRSAELVGTETCTVEVVGTNSHDGFNRDLLWILVNKDDRIEICFKDGEVHHCNDGAKVEEMVTDFFTDKQRGALLLRGWTTAAPIR